MENERELFTAYIKHFSTKWYALLSIALNFLGLVALFIAPPNIVLIVIVIAVSFLGIILSGYLVYRDLFKIIPDEYSLAYLPPKIGSPEIQVYQIGGNEYAYNYLDILKKRLSRTNEVKEVLPLMGCEFYFIIKNTGYVPVNILSINGCIEITTPMHFMVPEALGSGNKPIRYPITLNHDDEKKIDLCVTIHPFSLWTDAQIATEIRKLLPLRKKETLVVRITMADTSGETTEFKKEFSFSTEMLFNLYIDNWRSMNEKELLKLVGVK